MACKENPSALSSVPKTTETGEQQGGQPHECQDEGRTHFSTGSHLLLTSTPCHPNPPLLPTTGPLRRLNLNLCLPGKESLVSKIFFLDGKKKATVVIPSGQLSQTPTVVIRSGQLSQTQAVFPTLGPSGSWASWQAALFSTGL